MIHYFSKLRLIGLGSFNVKNIYQNTFSMKTHYTPPHTHTHMFMLRLTKVWKL